MRLVLDGFTAYEYWMSPAWTDGARLVKPPHPSLSDFDGADRGDLSKSISKKDGATGALQLLVNLPSERRRSKFVDCRCWSRKQPFPPESLYQVGSNIFVESPELCLVRLSAGLPRLEFFRALSDMLGNYGFSTTDRMDLIHREPITSIQKIERLLKDIPHIPGTKTIKQALSWIVPNAASPRETSVDISLAMPTLMGGHELPRFEANYRKDLTNEASPLTQKEFLVADVMWEEFKQALEYNSNKYHDTEEQMEYDFEKITTLKNMGYAVTPVSTRQFNSYEAFSAIVQDLRQSMGMSIATSEKALERRKKTHEELLRIERRNRELPSLADTARWQYLIPRIDLDQD